MEVGVVGGGITGLTAAYRLAKAGHKVSVFEKEPILGGLASSIELNGTKVEKYYHFICLGDKPYFELLRELDLYDRLKWTETRMSYFSRGKIYPFSTPWDLLRFKPIGPVDRLRFGLSILRTSCVSNWEPLDSVPAKEWLIRQIGTRAYEEIWDPLIRIKFGDKADEVSAAWIWGRAKRVAGSRVKGMQRERLGYVQGGTQTLIDELEERILKSGGTIKRTSPVSELVIENGKVRGVQADGQTHSLDAVVSTVALPLLLKLAPGLPSGFQERLLDIDYYGVACIFLRLKSQLTNNFWLNTHDPRISFAGIIEYTNLNLLPELGGSSIAYIPYYVREDDRLFKMSAEDHFERMRSELRLVNPGFQEDWVEHFGVYKNAYAQPICATHHLGRIPAFTTPVDGLYIAEMSQIYPEDRGVSNAIDIANKASEAVLGESV